MSTVPTPTFQDILNAIDALAVCASTERHEESIDAALHWLKRTVPLPFGVATDSSDHKAALLADILPALSCLFRFYAEARVCRNDEQMGLNTVLYDDCWRWRGAMTLAIIDRIAAAMQAIHLHFLSLEHCVARSEFAFLVGWRASCTWAIPFRELYVDAQHGLPELRQILENYSKKVAVATVVGFDGMMAKDSEWIHGGTHEDDYVASAEIYKDVYYTFVRPHVDQIYESLMDFVYGNGSGP